MPAFMLEIKLSEGLCDVNVAPDKRSVMFVEEDQIMNGIKEGLLELWEPSRYTFQTRTMDSFMRDSQHHALKTDDSISHSNRKKQNGNEEEGDVAMEVDMDVASIAMSNASSTPHQGAKLLERGDDCDGAAAELVLREKEPGPTNPSIESAHGLCSEVFATSQIADETIDSTCEEECNVDCERMKSKESSALRLPVDGSSARTCSAENNRYALSSASSRISSAFTRKRRKLAQSNKESCPTI